MFCHPPSAIFLYLVLGISQIHWVLFSNIESVLITLKGTTPSQYGFGTRLKGVALIFFTLYFLQGDTLHVCVVSFVHSLSFLLIPISAVVGLIALWDAAHLPPSLGH